MSNFGGRNLFRNSFTIGDNYIVIYYITILCKLNMNSQIFKELYYMYNDLSCNVMACIFFTLTITILRGKSNKFQKSVVK